jgi:biofilm PGA synthesis N-glycosyltransferase PgaC
MDGWFDFLRNLTIFFATCMLIKYWIFLLVAPWHSVKEELRQRRIRNTNPRHYRTYRPLVSVIVPAWNEEVGILKTVQSLLKNTYPNMEIVVVNDGSVDGSDRKMRAFIQRRNRMVVEGAATYGKMVRYFYKENGGKGHALNYGIERSHGEIVVTMDADSIFAPDAISNLVKYFRDPKIAAAVGSVRVANNDTLVGHIQQLEYQFGFYFKRTHSVLNAEYIYGGACAAFRRDKTFGKFGLFDVDNKTEDIEMSLRTRFYGLHAVYAEDVVCYTEGASTLIGLINQRLRWKKGRINTFGKYRQMFFSTNKNHPRWLTLFVLPYSLLGEFQLFFEPIGIMFLISYSFISGDYLSLGMGVLFIFVMYLVVALFNQKTVDIKLLLKFPFTWPLFYFTTWVEYVTLLKSLKLTLRGNDIVWQRWERKGVEGASSSKGSQA